MSTSCPTMISGWELEQQAAARRKPFEFITHQQVAVGQVRFSSGFTKLSASGPVDRYLACGDDAELVLTTPGMPVAPHTRATERITIPVAFGSIVLGERFDETDAEPYVCYMVSVPTDAEAVMRISWTRTNSARTVRDKPYDARS